MSERPPEGWYPDPGGSDALRYWNGSEWTDHLHRAGGSGSTEAGPATATKAAPRAAPQPTEQPSQPAAPASTTSAGAGEGASELSYHGLIRRRLEQEGFTVDPPGGDGVLQAVLSKVEAAKFGKSTTTVVVSGQKPSWTADEARAFAEQAMQTALDRTPGVRGMGSMGACYPVIVTETASEELEAYANEKPAKKWGAFQLPVVAELSSGRLIYCTARQMWGAAYWKSIRKRADELFKPT